MIFLVSGLLMEIISQGREAEVGFLLKLNASFGAAAMLLFTWFCPFGAQSRSEAGSLVAMFGVIVGWGIIMLWAGVCEYEWVLHFVPYNYFSIYLPEKSFDISLPQLILSTGSAAAGILGIGCYRFVKVRRYL